MPLREICDKVLRSRETTFPTLEVDHALTLKLDRSGT